MKLPAHIFDASVCGRAGLELCRALVTFTDYAPLPIYYELPAQRFVLFSIIHMYDLDLYLCGSCLLTWQSYFPWKLKVVKFSENEWDVHVIWHILLFCVFVCVKFWCVCEKHNFENTGKRPQDMFSFTFYETKIPTKAFQCEI